MGGSSVWYWMKHFRDSNMDFASLPPSSWPRTTTMEYTARKFMHSSWKTEQWPLGK
jgi:hypothetical protein